MKEEEKELIKEKIRFYQSNTYGAEKWIEDHVCGYVTDPQSGFQYWCPISDLPSSTHPITGRNYIEMWEWQKENVIRPATKRDEYGQLFYHSVVLCVPRGEGKTFLNALLILWRFFTQPRQLIVLGSNSRDQSVFAMYTMLREIIVNSPKLLAILGYENIREKNIVLRDTNGQIASSIRSVSAFSGILSNITAYNFTELFQQKNPTFFNQLDGSRRNIPNAQAYIDSTVSDKGHTLHRLYEASPLRANKDPGILFVYRFSKEALEKDFIHPMMTQKQLESFRVKFVSADFARFFKNTWELEDTAVFTPAVIRSMRYVGFQGQLGLQQQIINACNKIIKQENEASDSMYTNSQRVIKDIEYDLLHIPYSLEDNLHPSAASAVDLEKLSDLYDTNWGIGIGLDLADPLKDDITEGARSILTCIAKGLPGSRTNPNLHMESDGKVRYIYFLLHLQHIESNEIADVQYAIDGLLYDYGGIQVLASERWGASGIRTFCEENDIALELISPTYEKQRTGFNDFYSLVKTGFFKAPPTVVHGSELDDIMEEEMLAFRNDASKKWYGSETKNNPLGVQDDSMFSICWGVFSLRFLTPDQFGVQNKSVFMGQVVGNKDLVGDYED